MTKKYNTKNYDYLVVGAGPFGMIFAYEAAKRGKKSLIVEKRPYIGGNMHTHTEHGITVHDFGAHIFHTDNKEVWDYIRQFASFNGYQNQVVANYKGTLYNLPFNMNTFYQMWGTKTPDEAHAKIEEQKNAALKDLGDRQPRNLEEQAISLIGTDIYNKLIKGYTEKQWGRKATELPAFIIKRLPVRFIYDNNYFNHRYQGIPVGGYTQIFERMLEQSNGLVDVLTDTDFFDDKETLLSEFPRVLYTGMIDQFFDYKFGELEYRSLRFEHEVIDSDNYQGNSVINYTDAETPYTRVMEWKHFDGLADEGKTIITKEYPQEWDRSKEAYYPVNNDENTRIYKAYAKEARDNHPEIIFGGRLGKYRYFDMDQVFNDAFNTVRQEFDINQNFNFAHDEVK
ncbi:UDP-galactopyranose mutase [Leuconostoc pseudomesenteroides]|jgi:UDP-galactopyranose mutase|uniref:UDP-galactopyranose mutase n=1 Tax=Leuconostoc falkenbergense TaxID=2766470 RepID=A0ABT7S119_9LACO|nr:UDP-galactopyranose mutase [Leuconostoc falkenbergense]RDG19621.1 UDP-galactopyranose mutase [Leuconostoc pseudomesenteroides]MCT4389350.1 UDP-galactopyranose mutase [Leuconostoc falkenbergense]MCT4410527.1 UDP-galactopyranose mutase [Leuconostoc falkenbergense]MDM7647250.1 UDP-galactopyranose mutase [Leuconostoc falkenbergense]MDV3544970.1 UDP-galactopyranose mutase [Leuconostoc falkenbergense]